MVDFQAGVGQPHSRSFGTDLSEGIRNGKYMVLNRPSIAPHILQYGTQAAPVGVPALPTAAADGIDVLTFPSAFGNQGIEMHQITAQTLMPLVHATKGIEIALDQVDNESVEYVPGGNRASSPYAYLAGTDPGLFIRATFEITTSNGLDQFGIGVRKQENYVTPTSWLNGGAPVYTDAVLFGFAGAVATPNQVRTSTTVASAVAVASATNFFWTSGQIHTLEIRIRGRRVSYFINGASLGDKVSKDGLGAAITSQQTFSVPAYSFTAALTLIPFIFVRQDAALSTVFLRRLVVGQPLEDGNDPASRGPQNYGF